jgi:hypothetical protein
VFGSRIEVEPTFVTLSPFLKGDAFRLVQANGTQGVLVFDSQTEVRPTFCLPCPRGLGGGFNEHSLHARVSCREETPDSTVIGWDGHPVDRVESR